MQTQFTGVDIAKGISLPILTYVTANGSPNNWWGRWWPLRLNAGNGGSATLLRDIIVLEVVEMFMKTQRKGWGYSSGVGNEESCGEAFSWFLLEQFQLDRDFSLITLWQIGPLAQQLPAGWQSRIDRVRWNHLLRYA